MKFSFSRIPSVSNKSNVYISICFCIKFWPCVYMDLVDHHWNWWNDHYLCLFPPPHTPCNFPNQLFTICITFLFGPSTSNSELCKWFTSPPFFTHYNLRDNLECQTFMFLRLYGLLLVFQRPVIWFCSETNFCTCTRFQIFYSPFCT